METRSNYKKLNAYIESKELVKCVYSLLENFPKHEQYALCDQLRRAVISIPSNIAEGMGRIFVKEQVHFLEIAFGSLMEVDAQLDIARELSYITEDEYEMVGNHIDIVASLLSGLRNKRLPQTTNH